MLYTKYNHTNFQTCLTLTCYTCNEDMMDVHLYKHLRMYHGILPGGTGAPRQHIRMRNIDIKMTSTGNNIPQNAKHLH